MNPPAAACSIPVLVFPVRPTHRFISLTLSMMSTTDAESRPAPAENSRWVDARRLMLIAFGYAITLKLALFLPDAAGILAAVWPPGGVALAALLLSPRRQRRAILATIFVTGNVVNLLSGRPALASVGFMVANMFESWGGAWLFARWCGERRVTFARANEVTALAACVLLVNSVSSLVGATAALLAVNAPFREFYVTWWISDGMSLLLVTPLIVVCAQPWRRITARHWLRWLEVMALGAVWCVFAWLGFLGATTELPVVPRPYWMCVPLVWVGLRFGSRVTMLLLALLVAIAVWITVTGRGEFPLGGANPVEHLQMVQLFLGVVVLTGLTLAAVVTERKATEATLRVSEEKYRLLVENQSDLVIQFDSASRIQFVSPTYCATFGKSEAELVGSNFLPLVHEDDKSRVQESLKRILAPPHEAQHEERALTAAGWRWFAWSAKAVLSQEGQVASVIGIGRDITLRKEAEEERRKAEGKYGRLVEGAPDIIYTFSSQRGGLYYSSHVEAVLGYSVKHLLDHPLLWQNSIEPADLEGIRLAVQKFATGEPFDIEYRIKDSAGRWHWLRDRSIGRQQVGEDIIIEGIATDITASKQAQEALQHHRAMLARTEQIAQVGNWEWEVATGTVIWPEELFRIFQRDPAKGAPSFVEQEQLYYPGDMAQLKAAVEAAVNEGRAYELEMRALRADGETRVCLARGHAEIGSGGKATRLFGSLQDISERKRADEALQASEERFRLSMEATSDGLWDWDIKTDSGYFSPGYYRMLGYEPGDFAMAGKTWQTQIHPDDRESVLRINLDCIEGRSEHFAVEYRLRAKNGEWRWILGRGKCIKRDELGRALRLVGTHMDITDRKQAEETLRQSTEWLRTVISAMAEGLVLQLADATIIDCNVQAEKILGLTRDQILGRTSLDPRWNAVKEDHRRFPGEEHPAVVSLRTGQSCSNVVMGLNLPDGSFRWININAEPIMRPEEAKARAVVCSFSDITERIAQVQKLQALLTQTEQDARTKSELLREVNHRVTNNLVAVLGLMSFEKSHARGDPQSIMAALARLDQRIRGLLHVHRMLSQSAWAPVPVHELAEQLIHAALQAAPWRHAAVVTVKPGAEKVSPRQAGALAMVINELATNTVKHANPAGGAVTIGFEAESDPEGMTLRYRDNGPGYPPDVLALERSNIGLKLIKELVKGTLSGQVAIANDHGAVTTLRIALEEETRT